MKLITLKSSIKLFKYQKDICNKYDFNTLMVRFLKQLKFPDVRIIRL